MPEMERNIQADLNEKQNEYAGSEAKAGGFQHIPDGKYLASISAALVDRSKNGKLMLVWTLEIQQPEEHAGAIEKRFDMLETPENFSFLKGTLQKIGVEAPALLKDLPACMDKVAGMLVNITCKTTKNKKDGKEYFNIYLDSAAS